MDLDRTAYARARSKGRVRGGHRHDSGALLVGGMMRHLPNLILSLLVLGCADAGPGPGLRREVEVHQALWRASRPSVYTYGLFRSCFCPVEYLGPVTVGVVEGRAVSARYTDSGEPVVADAVELFPSVDGLFAILTDALDRDADSVSVDWDEDTGIPLEIFIDYLRSAADEEVGYSVVSLPAPGGP